MKNNKVNLIPSQIVSKTLSFPNDINTQLNKDSVLNQTYGVNKYQDGGQLPSTNKNIIPDGVLHKNKNSLPKELGFGGKGIPVVACVNNKCEKTAEIESNELILTRDNSKILDRLVNKYKNGGASLQDIGKFFQEQVLHNTHNNTQDFKHLSKLQKKITK